MVGVETMVDGWAACAIWGSFDGLELRAIIGGLWGNFKGVLTSHCYKWCVISMELPGWEDYAIVNGYWWVFTIRNKLTNKIINSKK